MARKIDRLVDDGLPVDLPAWSEPLMELPRVPFPAGSKPVGEGVQEPEQRLPLEKVSGQLNNGVPGGEPGKLRRKKRNE